MSNDKKFYAKNGLRTDNVRFQNGTGILDASIDVNGDLTFTGANGTVFTLQNDGGVIVGANTETTNSLRVEGNTEIIGDVKAHSHSFDTTANTTAGVGQLVWNEEAGTLDLGYAGGEVILQIGQELTVKVHNGTASTIPNGTAVKIVGSVGGVVSVEPTDSTTLDNVQTTIGLTTEDIAAGQSGYITLFGLVRGLNTSMYSPGDVLWVANTSGDIQNVQPLSPEFSARIGWVSVSDLTNGEVFVDVLTLDSTASSVSVDTTSFNNILSASDSRVQAALETLDDHNHDADYEPKNPNIQSHIASTSNPHGVTKAQVGLGNVDNTSDLDKPISNAVQTALDNLDANTTADLATKLDAVDYNAANTLAQILTVDGANSGLDADLFDGIDSSGFVQTSNTDQTIEGSKDFTGSLLYNNQDVLTKKSDTAIFDNSEEFGDVLGDVLYRRIARIYETDGQVRLSGVIGGQTQAQGRTTVDLTFSLRDGFNVHGHVVGLVGTSGWIEVRETNNDGDIANSPYNSFFDIYLVRSDFYRADIKVFSTGSSIVYPDDTWNTVTPTPAVHWSLQDYDPGINGTLFVTGVPGSNTTIYAGDSNNAVWDERTFDPTLKLDAADYNAANTLSQLLTVDGANSNLDSDLLDGQEGSFYLDFTNATNKPDPNILVNITGDAQGSGNTTLTDLANGTINITTDVPDLTLAYNAMSTGLLTGGQLSINANNTLFDLSAGNGYVIDNVTDPSNPVVTRVSWSNFTGVSIPTLATHPVTYITIDSTGSIVQQTTYPDCEDCRKRILIGAVVHSDNTIINAVNNLPAVGYDVLAQVRNVLDVLGFKSLSGNIISPSANNNLSFNKSAGEALKQGANFHTNPYKPHVITLSELIPVSFKYRNQDSSEDISYTTSIDPTTWDNSGNTETITGPGAQTTVQRVFIFPSNEVRVQRGQNVYDTLAEAIASIGTQNFVVEQNIADNALFLGSIAVRSDATDLSDPTQAVFVLSSGTAVSGTAGTITSLQQAYDISAQPEIVTNTTLGAVTIRRGTASDANNVFEIQNGAGTNVLQVNGQGNVSLSGTLDGRDIAADGSKLDGIEANATADQTASEILSLLLTVDGAGSNLNADLFDGLDSSQFLRSDVDDTFTGTITGIKDVAGNPVIVVDGSGPNIIRFLDNGSANTGIDLVFRTSPNTLGFEKSIDGTSLWETDSDTGVTDFKFNPTVNGNQIWHSGNDGSGSTLDADTVDSLQASQFLRSDTSDSMTGNLTVTGSVSGGALLAGSGVTGGGYAAYMGVSTNRFYIAPTNKAGSYDFAKELTFDPDGTGIWTAEGGFNVTGGDLSVDTDLYVGRDAYFVGDVNPIINIEESDTNTASRIFLNGGVMSIQVGAANTGAVSGSGDLQFSGFGGANIGRLQVRSSGAYQNIFHDAYHPNADTLTTARTISLGGDVSGSASFDGSSNITITATVANDSHTHAFDNLTGTTTATATLDTSGWVHAGRSSGRVSMTVNDGYGNANLGFNHASGTPDVSGSSGRITVNVDSATGAYMDFQVLSGVTAGVATGLSTILTLTETGSTFTGGVTATSFAGDGASVTNVNAQTLDSLNSTDFVRINSTTANSNDYLHIARNSIGATLFVNNYSTGPIAKFYKGIAGSDTSGANVLTIENDASLVTTGSITAASNVVIGAAEMTVGGKTAIKYSDAWLRLNDDEEFTSGIYCGSNILRTDGSLQVGVGGASFNASSTNFTYQGNTIWHSGNDGSGSGLDADTVDGIQASNFLRSDQSDTFTGTLTGGAVALSGNLDLTAGTGIIDHNISDTRDKIRVWNSSAYTIGMNSGYTFGGIDNTHAMTFQMNNADSRGFWWGDNAHTNAQGAMALTTNGKLTVADTIRVGYGEADTTIPAGTYDLDASNDILVGNRAYAWEVIAGDGSGSVGLTINDGQGNANITFNHVDGVPDQNGNSARITVNTDATVNSYMAFELVSNVTGGVGVSTVEKFKITESEVLSSTNLAVNGNVTLDNGNADGAQVVFKSSGFSDWNIDNNSGQLRSVYGASLKQYIDASGNLVEYGNITSTGSFYAGGITVSNPPSNGTNGACINATGVGAFAIANAPALYVGRNTSDGDMVRFYQDGVQEGVISVSGTTVSYNGGHLARWTQLPEEHKDQEFALLKGTVLTNLDEMAEWIDEETGVAESNEQLNRMKISDVVGDKNVSGVFVNMDEDGDINIAMTGDMIIRIAKGVTVQRGDLLMSAGDGTAMPQEDDLIRSKTIAKVTSSYVSCTYEDGSYCVPCVLMAC